MKQFIENWGFMFIFGPLFATIAALIIMGVYCANGVS